MGTSFRRMHFKDAMVFLNSQLESSKNATVFAIRPKPERAGGFRRCRVLNEIVRSYLANGRITM
jgi:hypothetical protein